MERLHFSKSPLWSLKLEFCKASCAITSCSQEGAIWSSLWKWDQSCSGSLWSFTQCQPTLSLWNRNCWPSRLPLIVRIISAFSLENIQKEKEHSNMQSWGMYISILFRGIKICILYQHSWLPSVCLSVLGIRWSFLSSDIWKTVAFTAL